MKNVCTAFDGAMMSALPAGNASRPRSPWRRDGGVEGRQQRIGNDASRASRFRARDRSNRLRRSGLRNDFMFLPRPGGLSGPVQISCLTGRPPSRTVRALTPDIHGLRGTRTRGAGGGVFLARLPPRTMATLPYFIFSPSTILSLSGLLRGPDKTKPTPAEDWRSATVDVVIPALNEAENIVSLPRVGRAPDAPPEAHHSRRRRKPRRNDRTRESVLRVAADRSDRHPAPSANRKDADDQTAGARVRFRRRIHSGRGHGARIRQLYRANRAGAVSGGRHRQRMWNRSFRNGAAIGAGFRTVGRLRAFNACYPVPRRQESPAGSQDLGAASPTCIARCCISFFSGSSIAARWRSSARRRTRSDVRWPIAASTCSALFDYIGPILGDDLTNSEDIFIGFSMLNEGYRNIQLTDVHARTVEPEMQKLPRQTYLWSSSFLQSCYYFDPLVRSPFRMIKRWLNGSGGKTSRAPRLRPDRPSRRWIGEFASRAFRSQPVSDPAWARVSTWAGPELPPRSDAR